MIANPPNSTTPVPSQCPANAVVFSADQTDQNTKSAQKKYAIYFVKDGEWVKKGENLKKIFLGKQKLETNKSEGLLESTPKHMTLIKAALAKSGINFTPMSLLSQPSDILKHKIYPDLTLGEKIQVSKTAEAAHRLFKPKLDQENAAYLLKRFGELIIKGEQEEAEKLLKADPSLLFEKLRVEDYSGRLIEGTAWQLALGAEDVEMCEMIAPYFDQLEDGQAEKKKQTEEQFPAGWEKAEKTRQKENKVALYAVVSAIANSKTDQECEAALQAFREYLKPKGIIKNGKHFDMQLLIEAFKLYDEKYDDFGGLDSRKNNVFWRNVIGYIQRYLPSCYAQAFCQGIYSIVEDKEKLQRNLEFRYDRGYFYFPLSTSSGLGYDYVGGRGDRASGLCVGGGTLLERLCVYKTMWSKNRSTARTYAAA